MTKPTKPAAQPCLVLFGLSAIGKPKAGVFKGTDIGPARKAAAKLGLRVFEPTESAGHAIAAKVPAGRIQAHGEAVVPFVAKELFASIESVGQSKTSGGTVQVPALQKAAAPRLPADWDDIKIGDRVLARDDDPADGWWQASVVHKTGDIVALRWPRSERGRPFQRHRTTLGLICPTYSVAGPPVDEKKKSEDAGSRFPKNWAQIGIDQIVLAKEDGPCEQWWEAKTIKFDKDVFTLQWRDQPTLPPIERPRSALGLMHPAPKSR